MGKAARRKRARQIAEQLEIDQDLAYQVLDNRLSRKRAKEIQEQRIDYEPFIVLAHAMLDTPTTNPLITLDRQDTDTLATLKIRKTPAIQNRKTISETNKERRYL